MPLPQPTSGEPQDKFLDRCMVAAAGEFPETNQRVAVCMKQWRAGKSSSVASFARRTPGGCDRMFVQFDLSEEPDASKRRIVGHATVFNRLSEDRGGFFVVMSPGAFARSIAEDDVRVLFNHKADYILGRSTNGTLRMAVDDVGLLIDAELSDTQWGRDTFTSIKRGDITQMSIGGMIVAETAHSDADTTIYTVDEFKLWDVSPVTYAAFEQTDVGVKESKSMSDVACDAEAKRVQVVMAVDAMSKKRKYRLAKASLESGRLQQELRYRKGIA